MQDRVSQTNREFYDEHSASYAAAAPHVAHASLRALHDSLIRRVHAEALRHTPRPRVLDLGAGQGSSTAVFLALGADVTAVDISQRQLDALVARTGHDAALTVRCEDVWSAVDSPATYDVVVFDSFLHHIPDYLGLIEKAVARLTPHGQVFTFQDPLRYDTLDRASYVISKASYFVWRALQGNLKQGLQTRIRRLRGRYEEGNPADDAEYHVTRNGVDQDAIAELLRRHGFAVELVRYFSTQSAALQRVGAAARVANTFGIVAQRA